jgi:MFS family permease
MTTIHPVRGPGAGPADRVRWRVPPRAAVYLLASMVVSFLAGSSAPTPLYARYQREWGFSAITTTVVFAVYALALLLALLVVGSLSDHVGRRPVLLVAVAVQAAIMVLFATAHGVPDLLVARVVQGVSTGAAIGALGAAMLDVDRLRGTLLNSVSPATGTAVGALVSGVLVQWVPAPARTVYLVLLVVFVLQGLGVAFMAETSSPRPGALASLRPSFGLPAVARRPVLLGAPALVAVWGLAGFYASLGPALVHYVVGSSAPVLGGLALFTLTGTGAVTVVVLRAAAPRTVLRYGTVALIVGVGVTLVAADERWTPLFFVATAVAGTGFGSGFQGVIRSVIPLAAPHERAGVLSVVFVISYLALGVPAVVAGALVAHGTSLLDATNGYGLVVMALAALALGGVLTREAADAG